MPELALILILFTKGKKKPKTGLIGERELQFYVPPGAERTNAQKNERKNERTNERAIIRRFFSLFACFLCCFSYKD